MRLDSCRFANAVKCGNSELNFAAAKNHEITLMVVDAVPVVRLKEVRTGAVSYTSLFNVPYWTMDERELEMEAEGFPPMDSLNMVEQAQAAKGKKKKK